MKGSKETEDGIADEATGNVGNDSESANCKLHQVQCSSFVGTMMHLNSMF